MIDDIKTDRYTLLLGDCLERLKALPDNSVDALVTDPPAGISFMNSSWDDDKGGSKQWINWLSEVLTEVKRVLKPGAHGFVWALPRTSHWTAMAIEWADLEIRDCVTHLFGSGFPKSLDVSKAIDKLLGAEREVIGKEKLTGTARKSNSHGGHGAGATNSADPRDFVETFKYITSPTSPAAKQWNGFGSALKPAAEFWWLVRKPLSEKSIAENVLKWGTGGINIDASRIEGIPRTTHSSGNIRTIGNKDHTWGSKESLKPHSEPWPPPAGRFPANLILDETAAQMLDEQSGASRSTKLNCIQKPRNNPTQLKGIERERERVDEGYNDAGGASRFFYTAKPSTWERDSGLSDLEQGKARSAMVSCNGQGDQRLDGKPIAIRKNVHPTVKPFALMRYLITMISPPGATILDPFLGSGTTGAVAVACGFKFIGIEQSAEYLDIAKRRIADVRLQPEPSKE